MAASSTPLLGRPLRRLYRTDRCARRVSQVRRSDFDKLLLDRAAQAGIRIVQGQARKPVLDSDGSLRGALIGDSQGEVSRIDSEVLVDASGQATFLSNVGIAGKKGRGRYDKQLAVFTHVKGALRDAGKDSGNTLIFTVKRITGPGSSRLTTKWSVSVWSRPRATFLPKERANGTSSCGRSGS